MKTNPNEWEITEDGLIKTVALLMQEIKDLRYQICKNELLFIEIMGRICLQPVLTKEDFSQIVTDVVEGLPKELLDRRVCEQIDRESKYHTE